MRTIGLYIRTSTNKQEKGHEAQKRALLEFCKANNLENIKLYEDFGVSGTKESREGLDKLMKDARSGVLTDIAVYSFSRFARSTKHLLTALDEFKELNIAFISISERIDSNTAIGKAMFVIISAISSLERDLLSERTVNGLKNAKAKGKQLGRPRTRNSKLIRELHSRGYSHREIARLVGCSKTTVWRELKACPVIRGEDV